VQSEWLDDNKAWRKDTSMFKMIAGSGVTFPPTEVLVLGSEALWKYMVLVAKSKQVHFRVKPNCVGDLLWQFLCSTLDRCILCLVATYAYDLLLGGE